MSVETAMIFAAFIAASAALAGAGLTTFFNHLRSKTEHKQQSIRDYNEYARGLNLSLFQELVTLQAWVQRYSAAIYRRQNHQVGTPERLNWQRASDQIFLQFDYNQTINRIATYQRFLSIDVIADDVDSIRSGILSVMEISHDQDSTESTDTVVVILGRILDRIATCIDQLGRINRDRSGV